VSGYGIGYEQAGRRRSQRQILATPSPGIFSFEARLRVSWMLARINIHRKLNAMKASPKSAAHRETNRLMQFLVIRD
jgi:hypothetical protein